jgi:hypothetical protein
MKSCRHRRNAGKDGKPFCTGKNKEQQCVSGDGDERIGSSDAVS